MNFKILSDASLEKEVITIVKYLNKGEIRLLHVLAEIERRRLYSKGKYPSLHAYCVGFLKLSNAVTQIRIDAMRAVKLIPEVETKLQTGELNLTTLGKAQQFFRFEEKQGESYTVEARKEILSRIENKSESECVRELVTISPKFVPKEKRQRLTQSETQIKVKDGRSLPAKAYASKITSGTRRCTQSEQALYFCCNQKRSLA